MKIRGSVVSSIFIFPHPPKDNNNNNNNNSNNNSKHV